MTVPQDDLSQFFSAGRERIEQSANLRHTVEELVRFSAAVVGSNMGSLFVLDAHGYVLRPAVLVNLPAEYVALCGPVPLGTQCCGRAALHRMPWIVSDMLTDPLFADGRAAAEAGGIRSAFSVPVLSDSQELYGSLATHFPHPFCPTPQTVQRNQAFAGLLAYAIARAGGPGAFLEEAAAQG